jgi:N-acylneuraminate cytidylyltransferase
MIGFIPARGGSKRIPRKNIKLFLGKPAIYYPIKCMQDLGITPIVSTDDQEIATIASGYGATIVARPDELADDKTSATEVLLQYPRLNDEFILMMYPTSVFATPELILEAQKLIVGHDEVFPIVKYGYPPQRALKIENGVVGLIDDESYAHNTQDFAPMYHDSGQFFLFRTEALKRERRLFLENAVPMIMKNTQVQDIDDEDDWRMAEIKWGNR